MRGAVVVILMPGHGVPCCQSLSRINAVSPTEKPVVRYRSDGRCGASRGNPAPGHLAVNEGDTGDGLGSLSPAGCRLTPPIPVNGGGGTRATSVDLISIHGNESSNGNGGDVGGSEAVLLFCE